MIFVVLSQQGLAEVQESACQAQAAIWHNPALLDLRQREMLSEHGVSLHELDAFVDPEDDKAIYAVLMTIEKLHPDDDIYIEMI